MLVLGNKRDLPGSLDEHGLIEKMNLNAIQVIYPVFRIRLDPYHWAGSGSTSGNVDLDPGTVNPEADPDPHQNETDPKQVSLNLVFVCYNLLV